MRREWILGLLLGIFLLSSTISVYGSNEEIFSIAAGVVPHHLLARPIINDFFRELSFPERQPETIILLSPDHFQRALTSRETHFMTVDWTSGREALEDVPIDKKMLKALSEKMAIDRNPDVVSLEFGITNLLPFIKKYLPGVKLIPLVVPGKISREQVEQLVRYIDEMASPRKIMVASVDFSHYLPAEAAFFHDTRSIRVLLNLERECFENIEVDSWQSLYAVRLFARLRGKERPKVIAHDISGSFLSMDLDETTSYYSVIFHDGHLKESCLPAEGCSSREQLEESRDVETILLSGDMMLDRGVEKLCRQNSVYYPFQKIIQLLRGNDFVFTNLEGPVIADPPVFARHVLRFAADPDLLNGIKWSQINLLSLANNHILDMEKEGFMETKGWLEQYGINGIGNPLFGCSEEIRDYYSTRKAVFLAFNRILPFRHDTEEILAGIAAAKNAYPEKLIIVSMHWGIEYEPASSLQQRELAHQMIDAGADLIVGHHPHVVQEIERYQNKLIF
ncbi:MAG: AmmeMemoRadiSam system protein B [Thermodesulfobacteriota bacterium]